MAKHDDEEKLIRSVAILNANSILIARQRAEEQLIRANEELERRTEELRATLESTTDGIVVTNASGTVTGFNEKYVQMWRVPRELVNARQHRPLLELISRQFRDPGEFLDRIELIYASSPPDTFDVLELADGRIFERFSKTQVVNDRPAGRVWSFRDVTERRRAEEGERTARTEAERASAMKDEFLATLSHELRTPLGAILGWAQVLRKNPEELDLQKGLEAIERNARVQTQLIEDLLDMSRIISGKVRLEIQFVEPVSFIEAAIETVEPAAQAKGIRVEKLLDPAAGPISGDPGRLQQVIWNLLSNAIKFTPKGGKVQVVLQRVNSHVEVRVNDTGIGIQPEFLPYVFERFRQADPSSTRAYGGLGLGLSIVKHMVELHGGRVWAESPGEGSGTTFTVNLPLTVVRRNTGDGEERHPKALSSVPLQFERTDLSGLKVLVVDDEIDARDLIKCVLEECGAEVLTAGNAGVAVTLVENEKPDVLVSDIGMPNVDGYELLKMIRALGSARGGRLPAIALTAYARSEDRTRALRAGFLVHVSKPVELSELVATVASVCGRSAS